MKKHYLLTILLLCFKTYSQEHFFPISEIDPELKKTANAVIREEVVEIHIESVDKMRILTRRVVSILNEKGNNYGFAGDGYSDKIRIRNQEAILYDAQGREIEKYKQKDFEDRSMVGSNDLYNNHRISFLNYTPNTYPFTIEYTSEIEKENTIFVQEWEPISGYYLAVEHSSYKLVNPENIPLRTNEKHLQTAKVSRSGQQGELYYVLENHPSYQYEYLSPGLDEFAPSVQVALDQFSLFGVRGTADSWQELGKWEYDHLIQGRTSLPPHTLKKIEELTGSATTELEKARIIYQYVQDNTRYISVQLGIGGWEPSPAEEVDRLKYGDCKGLVNYTKALLESQNIPSYYAVVYAGEEKRSLDPEFASMKGNHVILNLPQEGEDVWLECTSQTHPFNYLGDFTDDRNVLLVKPEGGEIVKTPKYEAEDNLRETNSTVHLRPDGGFSAEVQRTSQGIPYGDIYGITDIDQDEQILYYKELWGHLRNLKVDQVVFNNNRQDQSFSESMKLSGEAIASKAGSRLLLSLNFLQPSTLQLPRKSERERPLEIQRGRTYRERFTYVLPEGFETEAIPESKEVITDFGVFKFEVVVGEKDGRRTINVNRSILIKDGRWPASTYESYRSFMGQIELLSNQKAVLITAS